MGSHILRLESWLAQYYPSDVLMPVRTGTKVPIFAYRDGVWGMSQWSAYVDHVGRKSLEGSDICVVLWDLCIIDVDSDEAVVELENRFPILKTVACEQTKRGRHYWFSRSKLADEMLYFTSHGSVIPNVDFLSVSASGTGSIVCVAPSKNKHWLRSPWGWTVTPIPDELLTAVAVPGARPITVTVSSSDGEVIELRDKRWISTSTYFEPWLSGDFQGSVIPIPLLRTEFEDLVRFMDTGYLRVEPSTVNVENLKRSFDYLGIPVAACARKMMSEKVLSSYWMHSVSPLAWSARCMRQKWRCGDASSEDVLVDFVHGIQYKQPGGNVDDTIFLWGKHVDPDPCPFYSVLPDPGRRVETALPPEVREFVESRSSEVVVAGGFVLGSICDLAPSWGDIDIFVHSCTLERAREIEAEFLTIPNSRVVITSGVADTIVVSFDPYAKLYGSNKGTTVQLVRRLHADRAEVICGFDISASQVLARFVPSREGCEGHWVVEGTHEFVWAVGNMSFFIDFTAWSKASVFRIFKYVAKGFNALMPGISRRDYGLNCSKLDTVGSMLCAEIRVSAVMGGPPVSRTSGMPCIGKVLSLVSSYSSKTSGYNDLSHQGRLVHALRTLFRDVTEYIFHSTRGTRGYIPPEAMPWSVYKRSDEIGAMLSPHPSNVSQFRVIPRALGFWVEEIESSRGGIRK